jgi:hypothetical protein
MDIWLTGELNEELSKVKDLRVCAYMGFGLERGLQIKIDWCMLQSCFIRRLARYLWYDLFP